MHELAWYCLRAKRKSEHLAVAHLLQMDGVDAFCPRLRFQRATRRGKVWFVEAAFPGYVFAQFIPMRHQTEVQYANGVVGIVSFGEGPTSIPAFEIEVLRTLVGKDGVREIPDHLEEGDEATLLEGPFSGLQTVISRVLPASERVRVLLEFLGALREVEIDRIRIVGPQRIPEDLCR
jgi:transcriptional antiterminator RfaH